MPVRPILRHAIVDADGQSVRRLRIFCARLGHSMELDTCKSCPAFLTTVEDERIECRADGPGPIDDAPPAVNVDGPAGAAPLPKLLCVRDDVPSMEVARLLSDGDVPFVLVVDAEGRAIGTVWATADLVPVEALARDLMTMPVIASETTSVRDALLQMAGAHLRAISIVTSDGAPVGLLRDVDALQMWTSLRRR
jgi:CBS domain-containing protein